MLDVEDVSLDEQMPSFFLSETLKYLYLLFDEVIRLVLSCVGSYGAFGSARFLGDGLRACGAEKRNATL